MTAPGRDGWSVVAPLPGRVDLGGGYDRHQPSDAALRDQLWALVTGRPWTAMSWAELIDALIGLGRTDIALARLAEGHVDALRILDQADATPAPEAAYGVWASRSERTGLRAVREGDDLRLDGVIRFASGTGVVDRALVPVWTAADTHLLVDLGLRGHGDALTVDADQWQTAAMEVSRSHTLTVAGLRVPADAQVGPANFYLDRSAFFPGGVGVAACWLGGAVRVADLTTARLHGPVPPAVQLRVGRIRAALTAGAATVRAAAQRLDDPHVLSGLGRTVATEARLVVATVVHEVLKHAERVAGPAGLVYDRDLTRAVHDLRLYTLQANSDADATFLGGLAGPT